MTTINLNTGKHSLNEVLILARSGTVLIHSNSGDDFILEEADEFDREAAYLGSSDKFMSFLEERSREESDIPLKEAAKKRGIEIN